MPEFIRSIEMEAGEERIPLDRAKAFYIDLLKMQFTKLAGMGFFQNPAMEWDEKTAASMKKLELAELKAIAQGAHSLLLAEASFAATLNRGGGSNLNGGSLSSPRSVASPSCPPPRATL
jgi:hypothetical protein